ncbi:MAG: hypothetical protein IH892_08900, partial [Planctomycetes bacterium]|nr:hypothetical protein [Planctomycetota bacterium]
MNVRKSFSIRQFRAKLALAAAVLSVLVLSTRWVDLSTTPAYGLQETELAIEDIRHFHFLLRDGPGEEIEREAWVEYDPNGQLKYVRVEFYRVDHVMAWSDDVTQYWKKNERELRVFEDQQYTDKIRFFAHRRDPKHALGYLRALEVKGDVQIDFQDRVHLDEPISFTVLYEPNTYVIGLPQPAMKEIFSVDPISKRITRVDVYSQKEGSFGGPQTWEYVDYNQPLDAAFFVLENEVSADVNVFNTVGLDLGLAQGNLSDEDITVKVVKEFLEAWMAQDYARAIEISGYDSPRRKQRLGDTVQNTTLTDIVEIGPPVLPEPPLRGLVISCTLEFTTDGTKQTDTQTFHVRKFE